MSGSQRLGPATLAGMIRGAVATEVVGASLRIHRIAPTWLPRLPDGFLRTVAEQGAGVRLCLRTDASRLTLDVESLLMAVVGGPEPSPAPFELAVQGHVVEAVIPARVGTAWLDQRTGDVREVSAGVSSVEFTVPGSGVRAVQLWLPHDQVTRIRALSADGMILPAEAAAGPRWVHHGSSISQGAGATAPTRTWPVRAASLAGADLVNLGLSGNALLDPFVAQTIAGLDADVISIKIGINVVNRDCFSRRTFSPALHGFLDLVRTGHPDVPILLVTALACPLVESLPGPTAVGESGQFETLGGAAGLEQGKLSLALTRDLVEQTFGQRSDPRLSLVDGLDLFGIEDERRLPLPDGLHPGDEAQAQIAQRFVGHLAAVLDPDAAQRRHRDERY